ncbi:helix-turn-helix domain-containing protein [Rhodococcus hoagii]|nr:helix-turn-helix domain-containing protein [Prescottella equi]
MNSSSGDIDEPQWEVGRRIQQARENLGLSARAASRRAGIGDGTWRYMEAGFETKRGQRWPVKPTPVTLAKMARAVNLDPNELLSLAGLRDSEISNERGSNESPTTYEIDLSGLDEEDIRMLETFVAGLKAQKGM